MPQRLCHANSDKTDGERFLCSLENYFGTLCIVFASSLALISSVTITGVDVLLAAYDLSKANLGRVLAVIVSIYTMLATAFIVSIFLNSLFTVFLYMPWAAIITITTLYFAWIREKQRSLVASDTLKQRDPTRSPSAAKESSGAKQPSKFTNPTSAVLGEMPKSHPSSASHR